MPPVCVAFTSVNPARAGMIRWAAGLRWYGAGKPRASGDDPELAAEISESLM